MWVICCNAATGSSIKPAADDIYVTHDLLLPIEFVGCQQARGGDDCRRGDQVVDVIDAVVASPEPTCELSSYPGHILRHSGPGEGRAKILKAVRSFSRTPASSSNRTSSLATTSSPESISPASNSTATGSPRRCSTATVVSIKLHARPSPRQNLGQTQLAVHGGRLFVSHRHRRCTAFA